MKNIKSSSLIINGIIAVVIGAVFVFSADKAIEGILSVIGLILGISGGVILAKHLLFDKNKIKNNYVILFEGLFNLILGIIIFVNPAIMIHFVMFLIGLWAILIGILQITYFFKIKNIISKKYIILSSGLMFIILGSFLIFDPTIIASTIAIIIGFLISTIGFVLIYFGYQIHKNKESFSDYKIIE